jgi:hypothetical protein
MVSVFSIPMTIQKRAFLKEFYIRMVVYVWKLKELKKKQNCEFIFAKQKSNQNMSQTMDQHFRTGKLFINFRFLWWVVVECWKTFPCIAEKKRKKI